MDNYIPKNIRNFIEWCEDEGIGTPSLQNQMCYDCDGKGYRYLHGYDVTEMIYEDPDFAEDYFNTDIYHTECDGCRGSKVIQVLSDSNSIEIMDEWQSWEQSRYEIDAMYAAERAMGA